MSLTSDINVSAPQLAALKRAALNSEYHLLLGAGASRDSIAKSGSTLPGAVELMGELCAQFGVEVDEGDLLWTVYDRATESAGDSAVYKWFRDKFWSVTPPSWMHYYARSPWGTVWTLNVDDSFEAAHVLVASESSRECRTLNWDDQYSRTKSLDVVHLHGVVDREEPRQLVFSLSEYARSAASGAAWPLNFRDSYGNSPFVIIGARLIDEPDIRAVIANRKPSHAAPSFYVSRAISQPMKTDLVRWGLIPVEATAEDFALMWEELTGLDLDHQLDSDEEIGFRVGNQFTSLKAGSKFGVVSKSDFIGGSEPSWTDIEEKIPAELGWVREAKILCDRAGVGNESSTCLIYTGRRLSGRSTGLLQIGHHLMSNAYKTYFYRPGERLDIEALTSFASDGKSLALLFDGMVDIADDINRLVSACRTAGLRVICVAVDESYRATNIVSRLIKSNLYQGVVRSVPLRLSSSDARSIVGKLDSLGRLGKLDEKHVSSQISHFKQASLFSAMSEVENAPGFGNRMDEVLADFSDANTLTLVLLTSFASKVDRTLLVVDAARMIGVTTDYLVRFVNDDPQLSSVVSTDGLVLRSRHRWMALDPSVHKLGRVQAAEILQLSIRRISSRLNSQSFRERNSTALLVGSFMIYKNLSQVFPATELDSWYASLLDVFGSWSGRYWEQRAILARHDRTNNSEALARAESFAMRATNLSPDNYRYTTLGTVLMNRAAVSEVDVSEYYSRAKDAFDRASIYSDLGKGNIVSTMAYLRHSVAVLKRLKVESSMVEQDYDSNELYDRIRMDWNASYIEASRAVSVSEDIRGELTNIREKYDGLESGEK